MTFPIFLKMKDRKCVVVGAGDVAESKARALLKNGATVNVIGPEATSGIESMADSGEISWSKKRFATGDLDGAFLVVAATDDRQTNEAVRSEATNSGVLVNIVDQPDSCDFFFPAIVERGHLKVAISTDGQSPALAKHLKAKLAADIGPEYSDYLEVVAVFRRAIKGKLKGPERTRQAYKELFASDLLEKVKQGQKVDIEGLVSKYAG